MRTFASYEEGFFFSATHFRLFYEPRFLLLCRHYRHFCLSQRRVRASERVCWQCMSRIEHRMTLQATLDKACRQLGLPDH
jgi:hypothetical protein